MLHILPFDDVVGDNNEVVFLLLITVGKFIITGSMSDIVPSSLARPGTSGNRSYLNF